MEEAAAAATTYHADVKRRDRAVALAEAEAMRCREAQTKLENQRSSEVAEEYEKMRLGQEKAEREIREL